MRTSIISPSGNSGLWSKLLTRPLWSGDFPWPGEFSGFSAVPLATGCLRTGLLEGVALSRPRLGREAMLGQKSSALLSVWVLLSLLPVLAWALLADVAEAVGHSAVADGVGSKGVEACSWGSFPSSNPEGGRTAFSMPFFKKTKNPGLGDHFLLD